ncbi:MAG: 50S ribosomal protein L29 [Chloroflexi bacterium]|nr:MAG: 50S ribosomal protein L29 [Chloroflexota bacterium]
MSTQETRDARARTDEQLAEDLESAHQSLFNLRFQTATRQLADNTQMRKAKKRIARLKTLIHERTIIAAHDRLVATAVADGE